MKNENYSATYKTPYQSNAATLYFYKSSRKNAKIVSDININHLINQKSDRKVNNDSIVNSIIGVVEKIVYDCKPYKYLRFTAYIGLFKQAQWETVNGVYNGVDNMQLQLKYDGTIEQAINAVYDIFFLIYPYNTISRKDLFNNPSIKYFINMWYN